MANEDLGVKRDCPNCAARFYDLKKDPALCPKCGEEFTPELLLKPRRSRADEEVAKPAARNPEAEEEDDELAGGEQEISLDEAEAETSTPGTARKAGADDLDETTEDEEDVDSIDDIDVNIDEDDDDTLLNDDDDNDHLGVITTTDNDDER